jgi:hypothetical protein
LALKEGFRRPEDVFCQTNPFENQTKSSLIKPDPTWSNPVKPSQTSFPLLKILISQIGAREHYAVARALHQQGMLAGLVTDWYAFGGSGSRPRRQRRQAETMEGTSPAVL